MKTGVIFDLDGTLLDTLADLHAATNAALTAFGYPGRSLGEVRQFVGNGARRLIEQAVPQGVNPEPVLRFFESYYKEHCQENTGPYPGILQALEILKKRCPIAIVSNKPDGAAKKLCAQYFPGVYARGESADCPRKPAPDMVYKAMDTIGVELCIYVGDSEVDVLTAKNAGVPCLSVLWGFRSREAIGGDHYCESVQTLPECLAVMLREEESYHGK